MFTGIIQDIGTVRAVEISPQGDMRAEIETALDLSRAPAGASVACAGCCLTVTDKGPGWFAVQVSQESLSRTTLGRWKPGAKINLEPSLRLGDELGGHMVFGHVDARAVLRAVTPSGQSHEMVFEVPAALAGFIAAKGSVTVDGVSLTLNRVDGARFAVNIIPHTWQVTTMHTLREGDDANFEVDMMARYVARYLQAQTSKAEAA